MTLAEQVRAALDNSADLPVPHPGDIERSPETPVTPAAVLIAITDRPEPGLILTQRPETMRHHAGQVAFPGGRIDPGDADAVDAALREAEEEVALDRTQAQVIGTLHPYRTITAYEITPVVAIISPDLPLVPHDREVAAVFEVPLGFVLDPANRRAQRVIFEGVERHYYEIMWQDRRIWGATAAMLANLSARLKL